jgi:hypothetical protein
MFFGYFGAFHNAVLSTNVSTASMTPGHLSLIDDAAKYCYQHPTTSKVTDGTAYTEDKRSAKRVSILVNLGKCGRRNSTSVTGVEQGGEESYPGSGEKSTTLKDTEPFDA